YRNELLQTGKLFVTPRDFIFFALSIGVAGLMGYLIADRLCPRNYHRWLVWAFAPATGLGICSLIVFFFRRPMSTVEAMLLAVLLFFWIRTHGMPLAGWRKIFTWRTSMLAVIFAVVLGWSLESSLAQ